MAFCTSCGKELPANAQYCPSCGANFRSDNLQGMQQPNQGPTPVQQGPAPMYQQQNNYPMDIPNHLVKAVIVTFCCCTPVGIAAIVFAAQVNSKMQRGDFDGALESSRKADLWANWAIGLGIVYIIAVGFFNAMGIASEM